MRYQHILAATDFSELGDLAVRSAAELAAASGARLTLLHVLPEHEAPSPLVAHYYSVRTDAEQMKAARAAAEQALRERVPPEAREAGIPVEVEVRMGDPASEILGAEAQHRPSLTVIATHGRRGISRWIMGSVAQRVLAHARADVLAVRPQED